MRRVGAVALDSCQTPHYTSRIHKGTEIKSDYVLVTAGDTPALSHHVISDFMESCLRNNAKLGVIGMPRKSIRLRTINFKRQRAEKIVEEKDADEQEKKVKLCNTGYFRRHLT